MCPSQFRLESVTDSSSVRFFRKRMVLLAMSEVTQILYQIESGDPAAAEQLLPLVYNELRKLASIRMAQESSDHTLQPTALVHEAYIRLVGDGESQDWNSRGHFFAAAAEAMRRVLVEQARRKASLKGGGGRQRVSLSQAAPQEAETSAELLALNEALEKLEQQSPRKAELVKLRYFAGLTIEEAAKALGVAPSTANADWVYAKSWLRLEMRSGD